MKYKLINPVNPNFSAIEQILYNRGIPKKDWEHYLNTTDEDINDPRKLGEESLKVAIRTLLNIINNNQRAIVVVDADCDGYTSSAVLINYLHDLFPCWVENSLSYYLHSGKAHGLSDCIQEILEGNYQLVFCPDSSSNDYKEHKILADNNIQTIVLDHHIAEKISENAIVINNQLSDYPNKNFSGVGVTWQFCRYIDFLLGKNYADSYLDLVALGNIADMMDFRSIENKRVITKALQSENIVNPFISYMVDKSNYSISKKGGLNYESIAWYVVPYVNAITRSGDLKEKELIFKSMLKHEAFKQVPSTKRGHKLGEMETIVLQAIRVAQNVKNRQGKAQDVGMPIIEKKIEDEHLLDHKVLVFLLESGEVEEGLKGLIANKLVAKYQRPCCLLTKVIDYQTADSTPPWEETAAAASVSYQGSARGCSEAGILNFKQICDDTEAVLYTAGHNNAFGLGISADKIEEFLEKTDFILKDMNSEPLYYVDYVFEDNLINYQVIDDLASCSDLWGQELKEANILIKTKVTANMVTIYRKNSNTLKITLPGNLNCIKFNVTEDEANKFENIGKGYLEVNIVAHCSQNEFFGRVTSQLEIVDYEIVDSNKYYF